MNLWFIIAHENAIFSVAPLVNYLLAKHLEAATARYLIVFMGLVSKGGEVWPFWTKGPGNGTQIPGVLDPGADQSPGLRARLES